MVVGLGPEREFFDRLITQGSFTEQDAFRIPHVVADGMRSLSFDDESHVRLYGKILKGKDSYTGERTVKHNNWSPWPLWATSCVYDRILNELLVQ
ncbi:hypothetical protein R6Z07F_009790 [Ovis aries]